MVWNLYWRKKANKLKGILIVQVATLNVREMFSVPEITAFCMLWRTPLLLFPTNSFRSTSKSRHHSPDTSNIHLLKRMQVGHQCQRTLNKQSLTFAWEILWILHLWRPNYEFNYKNSFIYRSMPHYSLNILVTFKPNTNWRGVNSNAGWVVVLSITETVVL